MAGSFSWNKKEMVSLLASRPMAAAVTRNFRGLAGCTATGIAEFQGGRAGIPVAGGTREILVLLAAGAGVQGSGFVLLIGFHGIIGFGFRIFKHSFTNRTVAVR
jgi:hypothetical protein